MEVRRADRRRTRQHRIILDERLPFRAKAPAMSVGDARAEREALKGEMNALVSANRALEAEAAELKKELDAAHNLENEQLRRFVEHNRAAGTRKDETLLQAIQRLAANTRPLAPPDREAHPDAHELILNAILDARSPDCARGYDSTYAWADHRAGQIAERLAHLGANARAVPTFTSFHENMPVDRRVNASAPARIPSEEEISRAMDYGEDTWVTDEGDTPKQIHQARAVLALFGDRRGK